MAAEEVDEGLEPPAFTQFPTDLVEGCYYPVVATDNKADGGEQFQHQGLGSTKGGRGR